MNPLIIGIDPGTTLAYAILDFNGNLLKLNSSKQHTLSSLTLELFSIGKPFIISTDVSPPPYFVITLSKKVGAKLIFPKEEIKVAEKRQLTQKYKTRNSHEKDALFSALYAYKQVTPLFNKIDSYLKKYNKQYLSLKVKEISIKKNKPISEIVNDLEPKKIKKIIKRKRIKSSVSIKEKERNILLEQNLKLKEERNKIFNHLNLTNRYFFLDKKQKDPSLVFSEDPDKDNFKADRIIYRTKPQKSYDSILINLKDLDYIEEENYFLINKESYNKILQNKKVFYEIIKNYKKSR